MYLLRIAVLGLLLVSLASCKPDNPSAVAGDVVKAFSANCSSSGSWSQAALSQTKAIVQILEKLKQVDACKDLYGAIESLHATAAQIHALHGDNDYLEYRQTQEELQELTMALASASDPSLISVLKQAVIQKQVDLASARAQKAISREKQKTIGYQDQYSANTAVLSQSFANLFNQAGEMSACLQQSPSSVVSLFGSLASIAGSFVSPVVGSNMQTLSGMMNTFLAYTRASRIDSSIWDLYESQMPQALTCGLESMTNFYCQAEDAAEMVLVQADSYDPPGHPPQNFWRGIDLIVRRMPVLNAWLMDVKSGVTPQNSSDAQRMKEVLQKKQAVDLFDLDVQGALNEAKRKSERTEDPATRMDILIEMVETLSKALSGSGQPGFPAGERSLNPFEEFSSSSKDYACMLLKGVSYDCPPPLDYSETLKNYIINNGLAVGVSLETIQSVNWPGIRQRVERKVDVEFNDIIFVDPNVLLAAANEEVNHQDSPRSVLSLIYDYLVEFRARSESQNPHRLKVIDDTLRMIETVIERIDHYMAGLDELEEVNPLIAIYTELRLDLGTLFFGERISRFVEWDLQDRLEAGELPEDIEDIVRSANGEILHRLTAAGFNDLFSIKRDLDMARQQSRDNFEIFSEFMSEALDKAIKRLDHRSRERGETVEDGVNRIYGQSLGHLCTLVLATGDWPSQESRAICEESVLFGVYPDPEQRYRLDVGRLESEFKNIEDPLLREKKRTCVYHRFIRGQRLLEILREPRAIKSAPSRFHQPKSYVDEMLSYVMGR